MERLGLLLSGRVLPVWKAQIQGSIIHSGEKKKRLFTVSSTSFFLLDTLAGSGVAYICIWNVAKVCITLYYFRTFLQSARKILYTVL